LWKTPECAYTDVRHVVADLHSEGVNADVLIRVTIGIAVQSWAAQERKKEFQMTKQAKTVKATENTWPVSYINIVSGWITTKDDINLCEEDASAQGIRTWDDGITSHSTDDRWADKCPQDHIVVCDRCHKLLTGLKPNPFAIPDPPKVEDIKTGLSMTRALDSAFHNALIQIARAKATDAGVEFYADIPEALVIRNNMYPSFYKSSNNHLTLTWETVAVINDIIQRYTLMDACDKSEVTALKRLTKQINEAITEALVGMKATRESAITRARKVALAINETPKWEIRSIEDSSRNRGLFYVGAFDVAPQREGEDEWTWQYRAGLDKYQSSSFRREIKAYVDVRDGEATITFEQNVPVDGTWTDVSDDNITDAIARASAIVQMSCDKDDARTAAYAVYAREALITAGLEVA
jgi:hypothetical protein